MSSERKQLNLRMDDCGDLLDAVKERAKQERITVKELVIDALERRLRIPLADVTSPPSPTSQVVTQAQLNNHTAELKTRISDARLATMAEIKKRDASIAELASALARLEERIDQLTIPQKTRQTRRTTQAKQKPTGKGEPPSTWETRVLDFLDTTTETDFWQDIDRNKDGEE
jgi:hypothetical protein